MKETIVQYNKEIDNIEAVIEKLVTKQNSSVFDKICVKCNELFNKVQANNTTSLANEDIRGLIGVLNRLLNCCLKLKLYKEYLITVINNNIISMHQQLAQSEQTVTQDTGYEKQSNNVVKLELRNDNLQDAA